jgi:hypothetical protein
MVFTVEVVTGPMADLLAQAQLDLIEEICACVAHRRAAAPGSDSRTTRRSRSSRTDGLMAPIESRDWRRRRRRSFGRQLTPPVRFQVLHHVARLRR